MSGQVAKSLAPVSVEKRLMLLLTVFAVFASLFFIQADILFYLLFGATVFFSAIILRIPMVGVSALLLTVPFVGTTLLRTQIGGIPGLKIANIVPLAVFVLILISGSIRKPKGRELLFFFGVLLIFTIALIRSTAYIGKYTMFIWAEEYSVTRYYLSFLLKPLLLFLSFFIIIGVAWDGKIIRGIAGVFVLSVFLLSVAILVYYVAFTPNKGNFQLVRNGFSSLLNLHGNAIVDFYVLSFPVVLSLAFKEKKPFVLLTLLLSLASVGFLYSRGGYLAIAISVVLFLALTKRWVWIPLLGICGFFGYSLIPQTIIKRILTGLGSSDLNTISAGRIGTIWMPVIPEYLADPVKLFFGAGRYGYVGSKAVEQGTALGVTHAHNMYLDTIFDVGLIGLFFIGGFILYYMVRFLKHYLAERQSYQGALLAGILVALASYLIRGFTDSFLLPADSNPYLWIVLGIGIAIVNLQEEMLHEKNSDPYEYPDDRGSGEADRSVGKRTV